MQEFESECAPFQYALSIRAGIDCVGHFLRAATGNPLVLRPRVEVGA